MVRPECGHKGVRVTAAAWITALPTAVLLASGCATYRVPPPSHAMTEVQRKTCDEFARAEVRRLGESVPAALAKGALIGFIFDVSRAAATVHGEYPNLEPLADGPGVSSGSHQANSKSASLLLPWSLIGGPQLARDAARTNQDVYEQATQRCMAPVLLAQAWGPMHVRVATSLDELANCYMWQQKYVQAEPLRRQALAIWESVFGPTDSRVATALEDYATVLRHVHRVAEADSLTDRANTIRARLSSRASRAPAVTHGESVEPRCDSPLSAALFVLCRGARHDAIPTGTPRR